MITKAVMMANQLPGLNGPKDLWRAILSVIVSADGPVGQGVIALELQKKGIVVSTPTIGRRLQELEFEGMLEKVGVQGRIPTEEGRQAFHQLHAEAMLRESGGELLRTLTRGDKQHLLDLLEARLCLEGRAAALAATRADPKTVELLDELVERQERSIAGGHLGIDEDVQFHNEIATASGNAVLASLVALLREHHRYNLAVTSIRTEVGSQLVVDHGAILDAIKRRDPASAQQAMEQHLRALAEDLNRYWTEPDNRDTSHPGDG